MGEAIAWLMKWKRAYPDSESQQSAFTKSRCTLRKQHGRTVALWRDKKKGHTYSHTLRGLLHPLQLLLIHNCGGCDCDSASFLNAARKRTDVAGESPELLDGKGRSGIDAVSAIIRDFLSKSNQV